MTVPQPGSTPDPSHVFDEAAFWRRMAERGLPAEIDAGAPSVRELVRVVCCGGPTVGLVELEPPLAALAALARAVTGLPGGLFYLSRDPQRLQAVARHLQQYGLTDLVLPYHGRLRDFVRDLPLAWSAVVADGTRFEHGDAIALTHTARSDAFLWLHDAAGDPAWLARRPAEPFALESRSGRGLLIRVQPPSRAPAAALSEPDFAQLRDTLLARYFSPHATGICAGEHTPVGDLTAAVRRTLRAALPPHGRSGRGPWPYAAPDGPPLPPTLPDGSPWPKISIVTPSYNQGRYIEETILSVLNQDYPNVEHIVIDGGSKDETLAVLERYRDRLALVVSEKDRGQADAINKGFARATGEIFTWLNSDDRLAPGALAAMALAFHDSGADLVAGICELYRGGKLIERHLTACENGPLPLDDILDLDYCVQAGQFFYQPELFFTREIWQRAGGRVNDALYYVMDYELFLRFAAAGATLHVIGHPIAQFRVHDDQKTVAPEKALAEGVKVRDEFLQRTGRPFEPQRNAPFGELRRRFAFVNDTGFSHGAGLAHHRLARACAWAGHEIVAVAASESSTYDRTQPVSTAALVAAVEAARPDAVIVGNLHSAALDPHVLGELARRWPTLMVTHDQWAVTGRCACTDDCRKYLTGCDETCPTPDQYPALPPEQIRGAWRAKREVYALPQPPVLLANSEFMVRFTREALENQPADLRGGPPARVERVHLGFDLDVFQPRDPRHCREILGLPQEKFIILTPSPGDPRKGTAHLGAALRALDLPDLLAVSVGYYDENRPPDIPGMRNLGYVRDPARLALIYSAADLMVSPSLAESFGQVYVESAACGTPAIGYPIGGVTNAIRHGVTGLIAAAVDPLALADAIEQLYYDPVRRRSMGVWGRIHIENEYNLASAYQTLFTAMHRSGVRQRIGLRRKVFFLAEEPKVPAPTFLVPEYPRWRALEGFLDWEGPYPHDGLPRCRWTLGATSRLEVFAEAAGRHKLLIECRNFWRGQRVRVAQGPKILADSPVPVTGANSAFLIEAELELTRGANELELHHWVWDTHRPDRACALLVTAITALPVEQPSAAPAQPATV